MSVKRAVQRMVRKVRLAPRIRANQELRAETDTGNMLDELRPSNGTRKISKLTRQEIQEIIEELGEHRAIAMASPVM
jgi:hypothetical protein